MTIRPDWANFTFQRDRLAEVRAVVSRYLGVSERKAGGRNSYREMMGWELGACCCWTDGRPECWLSLNGDSLAMCCQGGVLAFFREIELLGGRCTRLDLAADFSRDVLTMELVHAAAEAGQVKGFRVYDPRRPLKNLHTGELDGNGAYFGRRGRDGSGRFVRFYDKKLESKGEIDAIRVEVELSGEVAAVVFENLCSRSAEDDVRLYMGALIGGCIDFVDRDRAYGHADRMKRLEWWQRVIDVLGEASISMPRPVAVLQKSLEYLHDAFPLVLAKLFEVAESQGLDGDETICDFARAMVQSGRSRCPGVVRWRGVVGDVDVERLLIPRPLRGRYVA